MKAKFLLSILVVVGAFLLASDAKAFSAKADASVYVGADEVVQGNFYAAGQSITIDGSVTGDVICAGQNVVINGEVAGDVICAGQAVTVNGPVGGNVRAAGNVVSIGNIVGRNVMAFGAAVSISSGANIIGDMLIGTASLEMRGNIEGELHGGVAYATIDGKVNKNINLEISENSPDKTAQGRLVLGKNALIGGGIYYYAHPNVKFENNGQVIGEIHRLDPKKTMPNDFSMFVAWFWSKSIALLGALLIALAFVGLFGKRLDKITEPMLTKFWPSIGWGFAFLVLIPLLIGVTLITVIGIKAAVLAGFIWALAIGLANIFTSMAVGKITSNKLTKKFSRTQFTVTAVGVVVCYVLFAIPVLGGFLVFIGLLWGLGGLWQALNGVIREK